MDSWIDSDHDDGFFLFFHEHNIVICIRFVYLLQNIFFQQRKVHGREILHAA